MTGISVRTEQSVEHQLEVPSLGKGIETDQEE